jgi:hypothetical protein
VDAIDVFLEPQLQVRGTVNADIRGAIGRLPTEADEWLIALRHEGSIHLSDVFEGWNGDQTVQMRPLVGSTSTRAGRSSRAPSAWFDDRISAYRIRSIAGWHVEARCLLTHRHGSNMALDVAYPLD